MSTYTVGQRVTIKVSSPRFGAVGTVEQVVYHKDRVSGQDVEYPVYTVNMDDGGFPNPIYCTDWAIKLQEEG